MLLTASLGGCATGYATDWFKDRPAIINPQLLRYGMNVEQSRCVSDRLGRRLSRGQLHQLQEQAAAIGRGVEATTRYTVRDLRRVASSLRDRAVRLELDGVITACAVPDVPASMIASVPAPAGAGPGTKPVMSGGVPVDMSSLPAAGATALASTWLNLGAAESGQSIAIDAMSIQQEGATRTAWFRMTDPDNGGPTSNNYRLRVNCQAKTVQPLALRSSDAAGQTSLREYTQAEAAAGPAESGTVLEIAYISLCT